MHVTWPTSCLRIPKSLPTVFTDINAHRGVRARCLRLYTNKYHFQNDCKIYFLEVIPLHYFSVTYLTHVLVFVPTKWIHTILTCQLSPDNNLLSIFRVLWEKKMLIMSNLRVQKWYSAYVHFALFKCLFSRGQRFTLKLSVWVWPLSVPGSWSSIYCGTFLSIFYCLSEHHETLSRFCNDSANSCNAVPITASKLWIFV